MNYTDRVEGFQIRDVTYVGLPPPETPPEYDIVKWYKHDPPLFGVTVFLDNTVLKNQTVYESCYSVGRLVWNEHERGFEFKSIGMRWLEENPSAAVIRMILDFAEKKGKEIIEEGN